MCHGAATAKVLYREATLTITPVRNVLIVEWRGGPSAQQVSILRSRSAT
jgi:hypothetical protein